MNFITSDKNPVIKEIRHLKRRKYREESKSFFIEGLRLVEEAFCEGTDVMKVLISKSFASNEKSRRLLNVIEQRKYEAFMVEDRLFEELSETETPQGIMAVVRMKEYSMDSIITPEGDFYVILESIQDPGNLGTIVRTADAAGATAVILSKGCVDIYNPKVLRSTMGSVFHVPAVYSDDLKAAIINLKAAGVNILASHLKGTANYFNVDLKRKVAIIIGNEANGISEEIALLSDMLVRIPMPGRAESLNASTAASILIYDVVRQRME